MEHKEVALAVFHTPERKILLQEREGISKYGEDWAFFGGKVEQGETPEQGLLREIREELEHELHRYAYGGVVKRQHHGIDHDVHYWLVPFDGDTSRFSLHEGSGMRLFTIDEALGLKMMVTHHKIVERLREQLP